MHTATMNPVRSAAPARIPTPVTLQHYPAAPVLREHVASYFSVEEPADGAMAEELTNSSDDALLIFELGAQAQGWLCRAGARRDAPLFGGPLFGAWLKPGSAQALLRLRAHSPIAGVQAFDQAMAQAEPQGAATAQRLLRNLRAAPFMAFRIVALDRYLIARLVAAGA